MLTETCDFMPYEYRVNMILTTFQKPPHTLIWAKLKGYPFWPAKALREVNGQVDVRFFGAHDRLVFILI